METVFPSLKWYQNDYLKLYFKRECAAVTWSKHEHDLKELKWNVFRFLLKQSKHTHYTKYICTWILNLDQKRESNHNPLSYDLISILRSRKGTSERCYRISSLCPIVLTQSTLLSLYFNDSNQTKSLYELIMYDCGNKQLS